MVSARVQRRHGGIVQYVSELRRKKGPCRSGQGPHLELIQLEGNLRGELDAAGPASAEERITDTDVAGGREPIVGAVLARGCVW